MPTEIFGLLYHEELSNDGGNWQWKKGTAGRPYNIRTHHAHIQMAGCERL